MRKRAILEIGDEGLVYKDIINKSFMNKIKTDKWQKKFKIKGKNVEDIKIDFNNKNIFIIIQGEEIYVKFIEVPKVSKRKLYFLIKDELKYRFKNIDNIMFTYDIFKDNGKSLELIVFCLNWNKDQVIEQCAKRGANIKGIYPIQFCALNSCKKNIKEHQYIFIFLDENKLYFLACVNEKVMANSVIENFSKEKFIEEVDKFINKCETFSIEKKFKNIFFLNVPYEDLIINLSKKYNCNSFGTISKDELETL